MAADERYNPWDEFRGHDQIEFGLLHLPSAVGGPAYLARERTGWYGHPSVASSPSAQNSAALEVECHRRGRVNTQGIPIRWRPIFARDANAASASVASRVTLRANSACIDVADANTGAVDPRRIVGQFQTTDEIATRALDQHPLGRL